MIQDRILSFVLINHHHHHLCLPELSLYPLAVRPLHEDLAVRHVLHELPVKLVVVLRYQRSASVRQSVLENSLESEDEFGCNFSARGLFFLNTGPFSRNLLKRLRKKYPKYFKYGSL